MHRVGLDLRRNVPSTKSHWVFASLGSTCIHPIERDERMKREKERKKETANFGDCKTEGFGLKELNSGAKNGNAYLHTRPC